MIRYECSECGEPMESPAGQAGKVEQCPHCGALIRVAGAPAAQVQALPPDPPGNSPAQSRGAGQLANVRRGIGHCFRAAVALAVRERVRWPLIVGLLAIALVGLFPPTTFVAPLKGDNLYLSDGRDFVFALSADTLKRDVQYCDGNRRGVAVFSDRRGVAVASGARDFSPVVGYIRIDYWRLGHEWIVIAALTGAAWVLIRTLGQRRQNRAGRGTL